LGSFGGNPVLSATTLGGWIHQYQLQGTVIAIGNVSPSVKIYWTILAFPDDPGPDLLIGGIGPEIGLPLVDLSLAASTPLRYPSEREDIRGLLGGLTRKRRAALLAGSPGWDAPTGQGNKVFRTKNLGDLQATLNDADTIFQTLHSMTSDDVLRGLFSGFLITEKKMLLDLLGAATRGVTRESLHRLFPGPPIKSGALFCDAQFSFSARLSEGVVLGGSIISADPDEIGPNLDPQKFIFTTGERMVPTGLTAGRGAEDYALIYYSGHGSADGQLQIGRHSAVSPDEIFELSVARSLPCVLILDMCYAFKFGERYVGLAREAGWPALVLCANSGDCGTELSWEHQELGWLRRGRWPASIVATDFAKGRGVYTAALTLALRLIGDLDRETGGTIRVSVREFNDVLVRKICARIAERWGLPLQVPMICSHVPGAREVP
jgi:hypothetical protein